MKLFFLPCKPHDTQLYSLSPCNAQFGATILLLFVLCVSHIFFFTCLSDLGPNALYSPALFTATKLLSVAFQIAERCAILMGDSSSTDESTMHKAV